jgi:methyltransferase
MSGIGWAQVLVLLVAAQRLGELVLSRRNERRLKAAGAVEHGAGHYPVMVALHAGWLVALFVAVPAEAVPVWPLLILFLVVQGLRVWVIASLGERWTTRVVVPPDAPPVRRGPYRWLDHPNYWIVAAEIALLPAMFGAWAILAVFSIANAALLAWRIRVEDRALGRR